MTVLAESRFLHRLKYLALHLAGSVAALQARFTTNDAELARTAREHNDAFFREIGIARSAAEAEYARIAALVGLKLAPERSVHRLAFAGLAASGFRPRAILEIGTSQGATTRFLATLFPEAHVWTVELPEDDPLFSDYHPEAETEQHRQLLRQRIGEPQCTLLRINSLHLADADLPDFDLIWLDGGHTYPAVAWDHAYALHKVKPGGWIFTDDYIEPGKSRVFLRASRGSDVAHVLSYVNERLPAPFRLLFKRETGPDLRIVRKFVGYLKKGES